MEHKKIVIKGLKQNNLKNISLDIPKHKIVVFTGVSGTNTLRLLPPLVISREIADEFLSRFKAIL